MNREYQYRDRNYTKEEKNPQILELTSTITKIEKSLGRIFQWHIWAGRIELANIRTELIHSEEEKEKRMKKN